MIEPLAHAPVLADAATKCAPGLPAGFCHHHAETGCVAGNGFFCAGWAIDNFGRYVGPFFRQLELHRQATRHLPVYNETETSLKSIVETRRKLEVVNQQRRAGRNYRPAAAAPLTAVDDVQGPGQDLLPGQHAPLGYEQQHHLVGRSRLPQQRHAGGQIAEQLLEVIGRRDEHHAVPLLDAELLRQRRPGVA